MADRFEDERGIIRDLLANVDAVTEIYTRKGHVRGNHYHPRTGQWVYVTEGELLVSHDGDERTYGPGAFFRDGMGEPHAWKAILDTRVLVFTKGPRSGEAYESDTIRLPRDQWLLEPGTS